jgi:glycosyltransferase involved in cell wall biosynthesis
MIGHVNDGNNIPKLDGINVFIFNKLRVSRMLIPLIKYLNKEQPDVIFTAGDHLNIIVLIAAIISKSKAKISTSSRVTPFDVYSNKLFSKGWILKKFMKAVSWRANTMTCVSSGMIYEYKQIFGQTKHVCVYNIIGDKHSQSEINEPLIHDWFLNNKSPTLVAAGMLEPWKGYSDLIYAMHELSKTQQLKLLILGDGSLRAELQNLINELELTSVVRLEGFVDNPLKYFSNADVFVHSSYVESFGNVLIEAIMCGCTVVSTDCPTGPREILQNGKYGYLVPVHNPKSMAIGIKNALDKPISKDLLNDAVVRFSEKSVINKHLNILGIKGSEYKTK